MVGIVKLVISKAIPVVRGLLRLKMLTQRLGPEVNCEQGVLSIIDRMSFKDRVVVKTEHSQWQGMASAKLSGIRDVRNLCTYERKEEKRDRPSKFS
jgi:hypothetical protein